MYRRAASCPPDQKDTPARQLRRSPDLTPLGGAVPSNVSEWANAPSIDQQNTHDPTMTRGRPEPTGRRLNHAGCQVQELTEMTIGRTDDPENPLKPVALEAAGLF